LGSSLAFSGSSEEGFEGEGVARGLELVDFGEADAAAVGFGVTVVDTCLAVSLEGVDGSEEASVDNFDR